MPRGEVDQSTNERDPPDWRPSPTRNGGARQDDVSAEDTPTSAPGSPALQPPPANHSEPPALLPELPQLPSAQPVAVPDLVPAIPETPTLPTPPTFPVTLPDTDELLQALPQLP